MLDFFILTFCYGYPTSNILSHQYFSVMKRASIWVFAVVISWNLSACNDTPAYQGTATSSSSTTGEKIWTEEDRTFLLEHLERTKQELMAATANLTNDQWHFKPDSSSWSIAQIVEHLAVI